MFKGVILSVMASFTFGVLYFYTQLLSQLDSEQTFGWRIIATLPFLTLFMWWSGDLAYIKNIYQRILAKPSLLLLLITTSILTSVQLWLFVGADAWAWVTSLFGIFLITAGSCLSWKCVVWRKNIKISMGSNYSCSHWC